MADPTPATRQQPRPGGPAPAQVAQPAPSQPTPQRPVRLVLPHGTVVPIDPVGTRPDGALELPADIRRAGWWRGSSRLGDPFGSIVVAAHVDSFSQGVGPFVALLSMHRGDRLRLTGRDQARRYGVVSARFVPRATLDRSSPEFSPRGPARLVLITCGGPYDASAGGYRDNVVVIASPIRSTHRPLGETP